MLGDAGSPHIDVLVRSLSSRGHSVLLASAGASEAADDGAAPVALLPGRSPLPRVVGGIRVVRSLLREHEVELVNAHYATSYGFIAALAVRNLPLVVSVWGSDVLAAPRRSRLARSALAYTLGHAAAVTATSNSLAVEARAYLNASRQVTVTGLGVDVDRFAAEGEVEAPPFVVLAARSLRPNYGLDVLIEAVQRLVAQGHDIQLRLAGDGPERQTLQSRVSELGLARRVSFLGWLPHRQMPVEIARSHVCVLPSVGYEGFGVAAIEAGSVGRPVVASDVGGLRESVIDGITGLLVAPGDPAALAGALASLLDDAPYRRRLGTQARRFVADNFAADAVARRFERVFMSVIEGEHASGSNGYARA